MARVKPANRRSSRAPWRNSSPRRARLRDRIRFRDDLVVVSESPSASASGPGSPGARRRVSVCSSHRRPVPARRGAGRSIGMDAPPVVKKASGDDAPPIEFAGMMGMQYIFLEQRAPAGAEKRTRSPSRSQARGREWGRGWLMPDPEGRRLGVLRRSMRSSPATSRHASPCNSSRSSPPDRQVGSGLRTRTGRHRGAARRGLPPGPDRGVGDGIVPWLLTGLSTSGPTWVMATVANRPVGRRQLFKNWRTRSTPELGPDEQDKRIGVPHRRSRRDGRGAR